MDRTEPVRSLFPLVHTALHARRVVVPDILRRTHCCRAYVHILVRCSICLRCPTEHPSSGLQATIDQQILPKSSTEPLRVCAGRKDNCVKLYQPAAAAEKRKREQMQVQAQTDSPAAVPHTERPNTPPQ